MTSAEKSKQLDDEIKKIIKEIPVNWGNSDKFRQLHQALRSKYNSAKESAIRTYKKGHYL